MKIRSFSRLIIRKSIPGLILIACLSCSGKPKLKEFNSELWKKDKKGCSGKRRILVETILTQASDLKGMDDDDIIELFGKPEGSNWETRGKKTFYYYTGAGSQCDPAMMLEGPRLAIEFNAIGKVDIITEQKF